MGAMFVPLSRRDARQAPAEAADGLGEDTRQGDGRADTGVGEALCLAHGDTHFARLVTRSSNLAANRYVSSMTFVCLIIVAGAARFRRMGFSIALSRGVSIAKASMPFEDHCTGETHAIDCPLFAAGVVEWFLRSMFEFWPCVLCGKHRGTSIGTWCHECSARAMAVKTICEWLVTMNQPRAPLPRKLSHSFRIDKRLYRKRMRIAVRDVAIFLRRAGALVIVLVALFGCSAIQERTVHACDDMKPNDYRVINIRPSGAGVLGNPKLAWPWVPYHSVDVIMDTVPTYACTKSVGAACVETKPFYVCHEIPEAPAVSDVTNQVMSAPLDWAGNHLSLSP